MSKKPLKEDLGSRFLPSVTQPVVHGTGKTSEAIELAAVTKERDTLAQELREIQGVAQTYNQPNRRDLWKWLNEIGDVAAEALAKLASGDLRKSS